MRLLSFLLLLVSGCSLTFDDSAPELPLIGERPATASLPRLNRTALESARLVRGADGTSWVSMREPGGYLRLRRLDEPVREEQLNAQLVQVFYRTIFLLDISYEPTEPSLLTIRSPGEDAPLERHQLPPGDGILLVGGADDVFAYFVRDGGTRTFDVIRRDRRFRRTLAVPDGVDPRNPLERGSFFFDASGVWLFVRDGHGRLVAHSTVNTWDIDLGSRPRGLWLHEGLRALLACGEDGLRRVPMDGGGERVLDSAPCSPEGLRFVQADVVYSADGELRRVPLDGSAAPAPMFRRAVAQILTVSGDGQAVYSLDTPRRWVNGASDGWLGEWRFMERGRLATFSGDASRLRWLEHAASTTGAGDLMSASVPRGQARRLALNVRTFTELPDGRVLAVANYAFRGTQNRIIVIDEQAGTARWVADGASGYILIPGTNDILATVVKDSLGFDLVRATIPPP